MSTPETQVENREQVWDLFLRELNEHNAAMFHRLMEGKGDKSELSLHDAYVDGAMPLEDVELMLSFE